jgi:hypothetical protein
MHRILKILAIIVGLGASVPIVLLGFLVWIFIPMLCAAMIVAVATIAARWKERPRPAEAINYRKAA